MEHGHKSKPNLHDADVTLLQVMSQRPGWKKIFLKTIFGFQGEDGEQDVCPRCQGKVFEAEKMVAKCGSFHKEGLE